MVHHASISRLEAGAAGRRAGAESRLWSVWLRRLANWRRRRQIAELEGLDAHLLDDIGLSRGDVRRAVSMPLDHDPVAVLNQAACDNRAAAKRSHRPVAEVGFGVAARQANRPNYMI